MSVTEAKDSRRGVLYWIRRVASLILAQYLIIGFAIACVVGYYAPCMFFSLFFYEVHLLTCFTPDSCRQAWRRHPLRV